MTTKHTVESLMALADKYRCAKTPWRGGELPERAALESALREFSRQEFNRVIEEASHVEPTTEPADIEVFDSYWQAYEGGLADATVTMRKAILALKEPTP
jgi:hypothetical protein